jgi:hypothetical protein
MDENKSLELHTPGKDFGQSYGISIEKVDSVLQDIGATTATMSKMKKTRALDGTQSASWDAVEATWSYRPDNGFDTILEEKLLGLTQRLEGIRWEVAWRSSPNSGVTAQTRDRRACPSSTSSRRRGMGQASTGRSSCGPAVGSCRLLWKCCSFPWC